MFYECSSLKELNLSKFNTKKVDDMQYMFYGCKLLVEINCKDELINEQFKINSFIYLVFKKVTKNNK